MKKLASARPSEQAELIYKHNIPYPVAVGAIKKMMPSLMIALINNMIPSELVAEHVAELAQHGNRRRHGFTHV